MSESIIGIDLGTTNSAVAIVEDGVPVIIPVDGQPTMPSCVGLNAEDKFVVGQTALNQLVASPERTAISVKRLMGQDTQISLGDKTFSPEEISAVILGRLKEAAEAYLGRPVSQAVITYRHTSTRISAKRRETPPVWPISTSRESSMSRRPLPSPTTPKTRGTRKSWSTTSAEARLTSPWWWSRTAWSK